MQLNRRSLAFSWRSHGAAWILALLLCGCASTGEPDATLSQREAIAHVIAVDEAAGAARNQGTLTQAAASVVRAYADALREIDLEQTPPDFRAAWIAHIEAWEAMLPYLQQHDALRGEMHELFDRLLSESNPSAADFKRLHDEVWSTWADVEQAMREH